MDTIEAVVAVRMRLLPGPVLRDGTCAGHGAVCSTLYVYGHQPLVAMTILRVPQVLCAPLAVPVMRGKRGCGRETLSAKLVCSHGDWSPASWPAQLIH